MKRGWFLLLALSLGLNAGLLATILFNPRSDPQPPIERPMHPPRPRQPENALHGRLDQLAHRLGLSAEQREDMEIILRETVPAIIQRSETIRNLRWDMEGLYRDDAPDPEQIRQIVGAVARVQAELDSLVSEAMLREMGILSEAQRHEYLKQLPWRGEGPPLDRRRP